MVLIINFYNKMAHKFANRPLIFFIHIFIFIKEKNRNLSKTTEINRNIRQWTIIIWIFPMSKLEHLFFFISNFNLLQQKSETHFFLSKRWLMTPSRRSIFDNDYLIKPILFLRWDCWKGDHKRKHKRIINNNNFTFLDK